MKILYVGQLYSGSTCRMREHVLRDLGHDVHGIDTTPRPATFVRKVIRHLRWRWGRQADEIGLNERLRMPSMADFDVLWLDKVLTLAPATLAHVRRTNPRLVVVGYSPDDMNNRANNSRSFLRGLPYYDAFFTTKTYGVAELKSYGCPRVYFTGNAFDPAVHRPMPLTDADRAAFGCEIGFVGTWEQDRAGQLDSLARGGLPVRVMGGNWERHPSAEPNLRIQCRDVLNDDYAKAICATRINLGFLRKMNRDRQTTRSIEIPACGAFMLAERTDEHQALFEEGKEAEFFSSPQEMIEKCRYYLAHEPQRAAIAAAGRERCLRSGYSYQGRLTEILQHVEAIRAEKTEGKE